MSSQNKYFDLTDDMRIAGRWHLRSPVDVQKREVDPWRFSKGQRLNIEEAIHFPVDPTGIALDFTLASFLIPVVHRRVVSLFERLGLQNEVQFIPVQVEGQAESWFILNALQLIPCIDDARCEEVLYWRPEDNRPDKLGQYRNVRGLKVDLAKIGDAQLLRPWGWKGVLIVSERVKLAMEAEGITGTRFTEA